MNDIQITAVYDLKRPCLYNKKRRNGKRIYSDPLWTAGLVHSDPDVVLNIHKNFLRAGADIVLTVSYQACVEGYVKHLKISEEEALQLIKKSVAIARQACKEVAKETGRAEGKVAGSVGPYGACLHDGSEYTGSYIDTISRQELQSWHEPRLRALIEAGVDMVAIETIPAPSEAAAIINLMEKKFPDVKAYVTFSCSNGTTTCHGEKFSEAMKSVFASNNVIAAGVNCTAPIFISSLLKSIQDLNLTKPVIIKPNSGEFWDPKKRWNGKEELPELYEQVPEWIELGASWIGGCCRINPADLEKIVKTVAGLKKSQGK